MPELTKSWSRDDSWSRDRGGAIYDSDTKEFVDFPHDEKWVRFAAEIPPELAELLKQAQRQSLGVNWDGYMDRPTNASRSNLVRSALRMYLNRIMPEDNPDDTIDGTATDMDLLPVVYEPKGAST